MATQNREVRVTLAGTEVAKWLANRPSQTHAGGDKIGAGLVIISAQPAILRYLDDDLGLPTLDPETSVSIMLTQGAFEGAEPETPIALYHAAIDLVDAATGGLVQRAERLAVDITD